MGEVLSLDAARRRRALLHRALTEQAPLHPALRWAAGQGPPAHRRVPSGGTACGQPGPLTLADPDAALCARCYPARESR